MIKDTTKERNAVESTPEAVASIGGLGKMESEKKRESRMRCLVCGGPLEVEDNYVKTANIMVRKRRCQWCGRRHESQEVVRLLELREEKNPS